MLLLVCQFGVAASADDGQSLDPPRSFTIAHGGREETKDYVDATAAGYLTESKEPEIQIADFQLLAKKKPREILSRITNGKQWETFLRDSAGSDVRTGESLRYVPDFQKELVLTLFSGSEFRGDDYMGMEVYSDKSKLRGYVFHGLAVDGKDPVEICKTADRPFHGTFYVVTVPKRFEPDATEFRFGYQSWGRECSRFSPAVAESPLAK
ncbi:MAG: hypothetical protein AAGG48_25810 [Planctomycetota bacterium]